MMNEINFNSITSGAGPGFSFLFTVGLKNRSHHKREVQVHICCYFNFIFIIYKDQQIEFCGVILQFCTLDCDEPQENTQHGKYTCV